MIIINIDELLSKIKDKQDRIICSNVLDKYKLYEKKHIDTRSMFLDGKELNIVLPILNKLCKDFTIFKPHDYCDKSIIVFGKYKNDIDCIKVYCKNKLEHKDYLGTIFSLGIDKHFFGDILIDDNYAYIFIDNKITKYILYNLTQIKNYEVKTETIDINDIIIKKEKYKKLLLHVTSTRIDVIISKIVNKSRNDVNKMINKNKILLNYNILKNNSINLKENDIFSISGYGKYTYRGISKTTKKDNLIIIIDKYN